MGREALSLAGPQLIIIVRCKKNSLVFFRKWRLSSFKEKGHIQDENNNDKTTNFSNRWKAEKIKEKGLEEKRDKKKESKKANWLKFNSRCLWKFVGSLTNCINQALDKGHQVVNGFNWVEW